MAFQLAACLYRILEIHCLFVFPPPVAIVVLCKNETTKSSTLKRLSEADLTVQIHLLIMCKEKGNGVVVFIINKLV